MLRVRQEVFCVEQRCRYTDLDGRDQASFHLLGYDHTPNGENLVAYARLLPPALAYPYHPNDASIGRVLTVASARGTGIGKTLVQRSIDECYRLFGNPNTNTRIGIRIGAQSYLVAFYAAFGFVSTGYEYLEDDIPHTQMLM